MSEMIGAWALNTVQCCDLFALCDGLPDASVDMILADLPYGTTACAWDTVIPFEPMWERFKRVIKPHGAIVLTAAQPFTSALVMSNPKMFRYEWVWEKHIGTGFLNANRIPLRSHESCLVFSIGGANYYPQMEHGAPYKKVRSTAGAVTRDQSVAGYISDNDGVRYPKSVLHFDSLAFTVHPTQKPVPLFRYLIRTYTQPGDLVLDPVVGSGTTALAAREEGRHFICGDISPEYVDIARSRLAQPYTLPMPLEVQP